MAAARNILVINDEAHHAWRVPTESKVKGLSKADIEEATKWIGSLDRIHRARGVLACHDFSATPFVPSGRQSSEEALFEWIVSDFGLNDAIESGLVKTPRVVIRDDGQYGADYKSRLYHIYNDPDVKDDLNRKAEEQEPLPDLVTNGYYLLGKDWLETAKKWRSSRAQDTAGDDHRCQPHRDRRPGEVRLRPWPHPHRRAAVPRADAAHRLEGSGEGRVPGRCRASQWARTGAEEQDEESPAPVRKLTKDQQAELLRRDGGHGGSARRARRAHPERHLGRHAVRRLGCQDRHPHHGVAGVLQPVALRAGGRARAAAHVVRTKRTTDPVTGKEIDLFEPEYVNIFGVPFTFLPHEGGDGPPPPPPPPKTQVEPVAEKRQFEIAWPNVAPHRPRLHARPDARHGAGVAAGDRREPVGDLGGTGPDHRGQARRDPADGDRPGGAGAEVPDAEDRLRGGCRGVRPDEAVVEGPPRVPAWRSSSGWSRSSFGRTGCRSRRRCSSRTNCAAASSSRST